MNIVQRVGELQSIANGNRNRRNKTQYHLLTAYEMLNSYLEKLGYEKAQDVPKPETEREAFFFWEGIIRAYEQTEKWSKPKYEDSE